MVDLKYVRINEIPFAVDPSKMNVEYLLLTFSIGKIQSEENSE